MIVRFCYAVYLQLLKQHNQEFRPYIQDPLSHGAREGLGMRLTSLIFLIVCTHILTPVMRTLKDTLACPMVPYTEVAQ